MHTLIVLLVFLVVIGFVLWGVRLIPSDNTPYLRTIITIIVIVIAIIFLLNLIGYKIY